MKYFHYIAIHIILDYSLLSSIKIPKVIPTQLPQAYPQLMHNKLIIIYPIIFEWLKPAAAKQNIWLFY